MVADWQAKRAVRARAKASAMDAEGARRHQRLDAQHDSATRRCRVTNIHGSSRYRINLPRFKADLIEIERQPEGQARDIVVDALHGTK